MAIPVLIITPNAGFGELISQILTESGQYALSLSTNRKDAQKKAKAENPALVILETDLNGNHVEEMVDTFRQQNPDLLLIAISPEGTSEETVVAGMSPDGVLTKPVYLPDLVSTVAQVIEESTLEDLDRAAPRQVTSPPAPQPTPPPAASAEDTQPAPEWLNDVNLAAQYLTRLSLESASQATLITRTDQIWAYAGELSRPAAEELARSVAIHFENGGGSDLARFIRLEETGGEYMLYATGLGGEFVLATVFDAEMPFSKIRTQASNLAIALSNPPIDTDGEPQIEEDDLLLSTDDDHFDEDVANLWPLLDDVPPPVPSDWIPEAEVQSRQESLLEELLDTSRQEQKETPSPIEVETVAPPPVSPSAETKAAQTRTDVETVDSKLKKKAPSIDETVVSKSVKKARMRPVVQKSAEIEVEPVSPSMYNLTYACLLIPRFPQHHLTGEVAKHLSEWITQLCVAFGWRLEHLSMRPDYMQWLVNVPPNTSPGYLMRTIRQHTSRRMFIEFPDMEKDNPSGDFWAPGYLILGNPQPPPATLVQEFIANTRQRQGLKG
ncbi:IS200/IS605 family transposase [bacterium]|nr:IS200/IS605 family transposase [bacterium]MCB2179145.1 IS200/IS605 family transposase [bacterium]